MKGVKRGRPNPWDKVVVVDPDRRWGPHGARLQRGAARVTSNILSKSISGHDLGHQRISTSELRLMRIQELTDYVSSGEYLIGDRYRPGERVWIEKQFRQIGTLLPRGPVAREQKKEATLEWMRRHCADLLVIGTRRVPNIRCAVNRVQDRMRNAGIECLQTSTLYRYFKELRRKTI
jgi:hypothetical protein